MMDKLTALGYGIVVFAIIIGVGTVVLSNFSGSLAQCNTGFSYSTTNNNCYNTSNASQPTATPSGNAYTNVNYMNTQLGSTTGGLASWTPAVIALAVGLMFLGAFLVGKGKGRY